MKKIDWKSANKKIAIPIGLALVALLVAALLKFDYILVLKGAIGIPLLAILPGWIWIGILSPKTTGIIEKLALSWMLSIVLVGWSVYGLRYLVFEKITNVTIIMALTLVVGLGLVLQFIKKKK
jgi:uncharacterized membrane protein